MGVRGSSDQHAQTGQDPAVIPDQEWRRRERENLLAALKRSGGRIYGPGGAATLLGLKPSTLSSRMKALGIKMRDPQ
jgi:transcriptional regulator with GAF, ATPase, and Fis domain